MPAPTAGPMTEKMRYTLGEVDAFPDGKVVILASHVDTATLLSRLFGERHIRHACVHGAMSADSRARKGQAVVDMITQINGEHVAGGAAGCETAPMSPAPLVFYCNIVSLGLCASPIGESESRSMVPNHSLVR